MSHCDCHALGLDPAALAVLMLAANLLALACDDDTGGL